MKTSIESAIAMFKMMDIKPNYSELARVYNINRNTVARKFKGEPSKERKKKSSQLDSLKEAIKERFEIAGVTGKSVYFYFKNERKITCTYSNFKTYVRKEGLRPQRDVTPHPFFETEPGEQLQVDFKENLKIRCINGEIIHYHILSATLGHSRYSDFIFTKTKGERAFLNGLAQVITNLGGITKEVLTDNMSAVVSFHKGQRRKHPAILQFEKDLDITIRLAKPDSPQTKGKDESANRFVNWLLSYDGKIRDEEHLLQVINDMKREVNNRVHETLGIQPIMLFNKEKEYLKPISNNQLVKALIKECYSSKVPNTFMINYKGSKYSVSPEYIGKRVMYFSENNVLYIHYNKKLIAEHPISTERLNVDRGHMFTALKAHGYKEDQIEGMIDKNFELFKGMGLWVNM